MMEEKLDEQKAEQLVSEVVVLAAQYCAKNKIASINVQFDVNGTKRSIWMPKDFEPLFKNNVSTVEELIRCRNTLRIRLI